MQPSIRIEVDPHSTQLQRPRLVPHWDEVPAEQLSEEISKAGIVGLGGAAFPMHVKLRPPEDQPVDVLMVNGCECEPYLTCDHRLMLERPEAVMRGTQIIMTTVGTERGCIGVEANKPDAIEALRAAAPPNIEVFALQVKYPQGAEKMLIDAIFGEKVPAGGLPLDIDILVNNVGTTAALADLFDRGQPLIERVVTVTGPAVRRPRNLLVPLGTPLSAVLEHCGGLLPSVCQVVLGGPMMGMAQKSLDVPVLKGCSGVLCLDLATAVTHREHPCIRCGRCVEACAMFLNPARLTQLIRMRLLFLRLPLAHPAGSVAAHGQGVAARREGRGVSTRRLARGGTLLAGGVAS
jgi:electron transport complex protein RnfC